MTQTRTRRPALPPVPDWFPRGSALLRDPKLTKGTAFTEQERDALGLRGLLPPHVGTQELQVQRVLENFHRLQTPLAKYILIEALQDRNEALFFRVIMENPEELMPIIYTPTVGLACQRFAYIYRRPRGLYISGVFLASIPIAFFAPGWAPLLWLGLFWDPAPRVAGAVG